MTQTATLPALQVLQKGNQWVNFDRDKAPINPHTGKYAQSNKSYTWKTYQDAIDALQKFPDTCIGIGRVFIKNQGITGIDLDKCINAQGNISDFAQAVIARLNSYAEYSPSGHGIHIWVYGSLPENINVDEADGDNRIEAYDSKRYFTVTGKHLPDTPITIEKRQDELTWLYEETMQRRASAKPSRPASADARARVTTGDTPYGLKALQDECDQLARTSEGARNAQLNRSAFAMGQLIAGGELNENTARRELEAAADRAGLSYREIVKTLQSGIENGMKDPRSAPEKPHRTQEYRPTLNASLANGNGNGNHVGETTPDTAQRRRAFNRTDFGNAERLVARYGDRLRYCHAMNNWLVWSDIQWKEDKDGQAERLAKDTVRAIYIEASEEAEEADRKAIAAHGIKSESKARIRDMLILAQSEQGIPVRREDLDANPWLLNCSNGTLDLRTGELHPHNRADLLTKCLATPYIPDAPRPQWESFLDTIFNGNTKLITFMQRALGYALTGDTSEQCFFLLHGTGQNGKSTLLEAIQTVLEDYAQAAEFKAFLARDNEGIRNDIARMNGKRLVIAKETDKGRRLAEALIKQLTGGDTITARFLHQEYFDFKPQFKLFLAANHKPEIKGTDLGIWRRVRLVPFTVTISESQKDKNLPKKLAEEAPGILAWLVEGCLAWQREGLGVPDEVRTATDSYRSEMDIIARFLSENCDEAEKARVTSSDLLAVYKTWCDDNGERHEPKQLRTILLAKGFESKRGTGGRFTWHGITLKSEPPTDKSEPPIEQFERKSEQSEPSEPKNGNFTHEGQNNEKLPKNASLGSLVHFSEDEQKAWLTQFTGKPRVTTSAGPGVILNTTPLSVQLGRNRIGVVLDATNQVEYFSPVEIEPCTLPVPKQHRTWDGPKGQVQA